jgi:hypothetical protein
MSRTRCNAQQVRGHFGCTFGRMPTRKSSSKRELIDTGSDKRYVRHNEESDDQGRSHSSDRRQHATTKSKRGQGDRGDR